MTMSSSNRGDSNTPQRARSAYDLRQRYQWLGQVSDDELRGISLCDESAPLQEGGEYVDISRPERGVIIGRKDDTPPRGACYVWRGSVSDQTWHKLTNRSRSR